MSTAGDPRSVEDRELDFLRSVCARDFPGARELRQQAERIVSVTPWTPGSASVDVSVSDTAPPAEVEPGVLPVDITVLDEQGDLFGEVLLWTSAGYLCAVEYAWYGDTPPDTLPNPTTVTVSPRRT